MEKRHVLNEEDKQIMWLMKEAISTGVRHLKEMGLREANIEIELTHHVKEELKK